jgi:pimeloyl-ACP methyl ester carboxylesterase
MNIFDQYQSFIKKNPKKAFHYRGDVINYRLLGTGKKLIIMFVGSSMFSAEAYFRLQEELAKHMQVLTIEDISMKVSMERISDSIAYLIKLLEFKKAILLGMSHGGGLAQVFARDHASQTEGLILYNTLTKPKVHNDISEEVISGVLHTIGGLKELRKIMPLSTIKKALLDQIKQVIDDENAVDLFELLVSKYSENDERQQMEIIKDLLTNYAFEKSDFKYLNYRSLVFYGYDEDPLGGTNLIEILVDLMTNPTLRFIETDRFELIINPQPMVSSILEFLKINEQKSAL